jgi:hypothetical protein
MTLKISDLIKCRQYLSDDDVYDIMIKAAPAIGWLYTTKNSPHYISGEVSLRARNDGRYPYNYLEMIENQFGPEDNVIEVCSYNSRYPEPDITTVDINPDNKPKIVDDAQVLSKVKSDIFDRWRCDPPYNEETAKRMYGSKLPSTLKMLEAGARVCKANSLMFLLLGPQNYQKCPAGIRRIGWIPISIIPNNELRALHIYYKE